MTLAPMGGGLQGDALTGTIHFNIAGENGTKVSVDEYDMSVKYRKHYPNLKFDFNTETMDVKEAYDISFYNVDIEHMNNEI
jgi:hypothetical protein